MPFRSVLLRIAGVIALIGFTAILSVAFALGFALAAEAGAAGVVGAFEHPLATADPPLPGGRTGRRDRPAAKAIADRP